MIKPASMLQLQQDGGGGGGSTYTTQDEPAPAEQEDYLQPIEDDPGGPTGMEIQPVEDSPGGQGGGGEFSGNPANQEKPAPEFTNQTEQPTAAAGSPDQAGYSTPVIIGVLLLIMLLFNYNMKKG